MAAVATHPVNSRNAPTPMSSDVYTNGQHPPPAPAAPQKKGKAKKAPAVTDAQDLIQSRLAQLEKESVGEKEQEAEIEREVKKTSREMSSTLSGYSDHGARIDYVQKKYNELLADMKRLQIEYNKTKKQRDQLQKEKDTSRTELNKVTGLKEKLEKLCRELTKENKKVKDEKKYIEESQARMAEELHERLENLVFDVDEAILKREESEVPAVDQSVDEMFRQKFKSFIDQYELRELQFASLLKVKELEAQYYMARYEREKKQQEMESSKSHQLTRQVSTFSQTETELRSQLNIYVEKFKQVEDTLNNSNDLFLTFRKEMEEMSKKTKRLEKENQGLTRKQEATNRSILEMAEERTRMNKEVELLRERNKKLENLCRGMQAQGRGQVPVGELEGEEDGTESEYEYDEDEEGSGEEYDEDTEEEAMIDARPRTFGPPPPPQQPQQNGAQATRAPAPGSRAAFKTNRVPNGVTNGVVSH